MIDNNDPALQKTAKKPPNKFIQVPTYIVTLLAAVLVSIALSTVVEWTGMALNLWQEGGYLHAKNVFTTELQWVLGDMLSSMHFLTWLYSSIFEFINFYLIEQTGLKSLVAGELTLSLLWLIILPLSIKFIAFWTPVRNDIIMRNFLSFVALLPILFFAAIAIDILFQWHFLRDYLFAFIYIVQITIVRLLTILFAIPSVVLLLLYLIAHGVYLREMRRLSGDVESTLIYGFSKQWIKPLIGLPLMLLLSSPFSIHPTIFVLVATFVPGSFLLVSIAYFKKYL